VLCDFGLGKRTDGDLSDSGRQYGPLYATAPEVRLGEVYNEEADIYSFGILVWELTQMYLRVHGEVSMPATVVEMILGCLHDKIEERMSLDDAGGCLEEFLFDYGVEARVDNVEWIQENEAWERFSKVVAGNSALFQAASSNSKMITFSW